MSGLMSPVYRPSSEVEAGGPLTTFGSKNICRAIDPEPQEAAGEGNWAVANRLLNEVSADG